LAASLRYREKSSFTFARAIRRGRSTLLREPTLGLALRDDREDFDVCLCNVIEHPDLVCPEPVLRPPQATQPLDAATTELGGLMAQVLLDGAPHTRSDVSAKFPKPCDRIWGEDDLKSNSLLGATLISSAERIPHHVPDLPIQVPVRC
jgi:hypothetical protein